MKNADPRIDAYIADAASFAQPILRHLRELVHRACPDVEETIKWSFPNFVLNGSILGSMAAFKEHCSFGLWHHGMQPVLAKDGYSGEGSAGSFGRITQIADLPSDAKLLGYLRQAIALNEAGVPARPKPAVPKGKAPLVVPPDLAAALKKSKAAAKTFEGFSYSHRKEYIEWITEAKREETRQKRVATTIEWLAVGKGRNWKYENC